MNNPMLSAENKRLPLHSGTKLQNENKDKNTDYV